MKLTTKTDHYNFEIDLGEDLFGDLNPLQKMLPENYFTFCTEALEQL